MTRRSEELVLGEWWVRKLKNIIEVTAEVWRNLHFGYSLRMTRIIQSI